MNVEKINVTNKDGQTMECDVLMHVNNPDFNKNYIIYTDGHVNEAGKLRLLASEYFPDGDLTRLEPITDNAEWEYLEKVMANIESQVDK